MRAHLVQDQSFNWTDRLYYNAAGWQGHWHPQACVPALEQAQEGSLATLACFIHHPDGCTTCNRSQGMWW